MSIRRNVVTAVVAALIASGGLAGCSDGEADEPPDSGLPSKSELSESTPTSPATEPTKSPAPELPSEATQPGRSGAKAFVQYYVELENYASDTGDSGPLSQYSHPRCGGCGDLVRFYRTWYERGGWFKGGHRRITTFDRVFPTPSPHDMYIRISGKTDSGTYRERRSASVQHARGDSFVLLLWLVRGPQGWRVSRLDTP